MAELRARAEPVPGLHPRASVPSIEDHLLYVCGEAAASPSRNSLRWACDARLLIERGRERLDWTRVLRGARRLRLSPPLTVLLRYLSRELRVDAPDETLAALESDAAAADDLTLEVALLCAVRGSVPRLRGVISDTPGVRTRLAILRPVLLPTPAALRATYGGATPLPLLYLLRPARFLIARLRPPAGR